MESLHKFITQWWNAAAKQELLWNKISGWCLFPDSFFVKRGKSSDCYIYIGVVLRQQSVYFWPLRNGHQSCATLRDSQDRIQWNMEWSIRDSLLFHPSSSESADITIFTSKREFEGTCPWVQSKEDFLITPYLGQTCNKEDLAEGRGFPSFMQENWENLWILIATSSLLTTWAKVRKCIFLAKVFLT